MTPVMIFWQIAGFLIQTVPIAALCFLPFSPKEFRLSERSTRITILLLPGIFSLGFGAIGFASYDPAQELNALIPNLYMLGFILIWCVFYFWNIRAKVMAKLLILVMMIHYAAIVYTLANTALDIFDLNSTHVIYNVATILFHLILQSIAFPFMFLFLKKIVARCLPIMGDKTLYWGCLSFSIALLLYCASVFLLTNYSLYYSSIQVEALLVVIILTDAIIYYFFFAKIQLFAQNQQLQTQLHQFNEQYRVFTGSVEDARRFRHDMRQHLRVIAELNQMDKREELAKYLERYTKTYQAIESQPLSGYSAVDNILRYYLGRAEAEGVRMETKLCPLSDALPFDATDITVLLGNLMENAMEACQRLPAHMDRYATISIQQRDVSLLIRVENSCPAGDPEYSTFTDYSVFHSTKPKALHGLGLQSIQFVAEKYGGSAEYKREKGVFLTRVVLNLPRGVSPSI